MKEAAGNRCIRCGHQSGDGLIRASEGERFRSGAEFVKRFAPCDPKCSHRVDGRLRVLTVHHLDGDKSNCAWWNLLALCQVCHLSVQSRVIPQRPWILEHSPWFVPFVCGFYAHYYGSLEITRAQAEAEPHRWLALGQPWLSPAAPQ